MNNKDYNKKIEQFEKNIGYTFKDKKLCLNALTHSSYAAEHKLPYYKNNERLEFLGDAVLQLVSSNAIFKDNPDKKEGQMTKIRSSLVCEDSLAASAAKISLGDFIFLGNGEKLFGGKNKFSILSDAFEAVIGAIYLDSGLEKASEFIEKFVLTNKDMVFVSDPKSSLQEKVQSMGENTIEYKLLSETGPDHEKIFEFSCVINGVEMGRGQEKSKKKAQQKAAYIALMKINKEWSK